MNENIRFQWRTTWATKKQSKDIEISHGGSNSYDHRGPKKWGSIQKNIPSNTYPLKTMESTYIMWWALPSRENKNGEGHGLYNFLHINALFSLMTHPWHHRTWIGNIHWPWKRQAHQNNITTQKWAYHRAQLKEPPTTISNSKNHWKHLKKEKTNMNENNK